MHRNASVAVSRRFTTVTPTASTLVSAFGKCASREVRKTFTSQVPHVDAVAMARLLEAPEMADRVLEKLSPGTRRYLVVAAASSEWQPETQLSKTMDAVDEDRDSKISAQEYLKWFERSFEAKHGLSWRTLCLVAAYAGAPFVAFGCLDNSLMLLSGDAIDGMFGERFGLTAMGAAALGGVCSGALGVQFHGATQRVLHHILPRQGIPTFAKRFRAYKTAGTIGTSCGIALGLTIGMAPLMWMTPRH
ncbi:Hypothetical protein, putative [Bodo saltans]|uniref:EF-hand domain-containing protein n=1 Tax=Bodo saltans TaxID=75058 RepID=A0A0S4J5S5_BODSA|nr:Hypothetical protein, putative [Bodo saltans]|eukprot:CUG86784.1 Hypothetical protein, putative [Bodo saltans]